MLPVARAMGRMLDELYRNPDLGLLHHESWPGRTVILVQYWRSLEQLMDYARSRDAVHLPAWAEFNRRVGSNGDVGIWHETYDVPARGYETVYNNMPSFGLSRALGSVPASEVRSTAGGRMGRTAGDDAPVDERGRLE